MGALGGRKEIMEQLAPLGSVYQAGTLSGNPVAVAAGMQTIKLLRDESPYLKLEILGQRLAKGINRIATERSLPFIARNEVVCLHPSSGKSLSLI